MSLAAVCALLAEPLGYAYMRHAMLAAALAGGVCAFFSCFLMLRGWSLMGDAISHAIVPGVAGAYLLGLPYSLGAFFSGALAAGVMLLINSRTRLKQDVVIGVTFSTFLGLGLFIISLAPAGISIQTIALGNVLAITPLDLAQLVAISLLTFLALLLKWRDWLAVFFDESHARSVGLHVTALKAGFFAMLAACTIAAMQAVGAFLVIALIITPGATAWLLSDRFGRVAAIATAIGVASGLIGAWASYFLDGATGAVIVLLQTALFALAFVFAPRHGLLAARRRARASASKADAPAAARSCS
ncbi:metal ABC transporter permease [Ottowia cancrivicina]|uniref:Metal ABC transporter permease n=1 Tax=Ottowia cancrivicina TaxID=3040346 RepID=A0AAW6RIH6_9BURK|nr:metal ABC transporter permease [Ottowia sp. 10c7w1]MDG9698306.1 metal ABC transporter permease [Ottowia sp. 10c7w1]